MAEGMLLLFAQKVSISLFKITVCSVSVREIVTYFFKKIPLVDLASHVKEKMICPESKSFEQSLHKSLRFLKAEFDSRYAKCWRNKRMFFQKYTNWLDSHFKVQDPSPKKNVGGRPKKSFCEDSQRTRLRSTEELRKKYTTAELISATASALRSDGFRSVAWLVEHLFTFPEKAAHLKKIAQSSAKPGIERFTADDSLRFLCENDLSKQQYQNIRNMSLKKGLDIYPAYNDIRDNKMLCYPSGISIRPSCAEVPLQNVVDHTVERLFMAVNKSMETFIHAQGIFSVVLKWGCDGSSNHSRYKMPFFEKVGEDVISYNDSHIFLVCLVPLRIYFTPVSGEKQIVWNNNSPSSINLCRPIKMVFQKETAELTKQEVEGMKLQIQNLKRTKVTIHGVSAEVSSELILSMIDGKVINNITGTHSHACNLCGASGKALSNRIDAQICDDPDRIETIPVLHAYIRSMELLLNVAYRIPLKKWRVNRGNEILIERQRTIKEEFKKIGLRISEPLPSGGNSNDGNTARRFFQNTEITAKITGIEEDVLHRFVTILSALSSKLEIDVKAFETYAEETRRLFVHYYDFYPLSPTVHRILVHGATIISHCDIPIGLLSEEAQERRNKSIRKYREHHSRQFSRLANIEDVFHRLLLTSDPVMTMQTQFPQTEKEQFPEPVQTLLK